MLSVAKIYRWEKGSAARTRIWIPILSTHSWSLVACTVWAWGCGTAQGNLRPGVMVVYGVGEKWGAEEPPTLQEATCKFIQVYLCQVPRAILEVRGLALMGWM